MKHTTVCTKQRFRMGYYLPPSLAGLTAMKAAAARAVLIAIAVVTAMAAMATMTACSTLAPRPTPTEVRGTWLTTTANDAIATPVNTAKTMQRLREIGLNTVYVEAWKDGYTQFPSQTLKQAIGINQKPPLTSAAKDTPTPRDLMTETLIEAHRNGLIYVAWFEYGFMAAHRDTMNHLRIQKTDWLSLDIKGNAVAPNGFVWLNPLHPDARKLLLDLVLEAIDQYDLDGVQLDDRIVWPHITMGYDDYTKKIYASEHDGREPPADYRDAEWMQWRADKINEYAKIFTQTIRAKRPGLLISLSPAVYPWSWENYLLAWPQWSAWQAKDRIQTGFPNNSTPITAAAFTPRWDEFIPQVYRFDYPSFEKTWLAQIDAIKSADIQNQKNQDRHHDLLAGIRIVGDGKDSSWEQLRDSMLLARKTEAGGHVLWFSRGVLDVFPNELTDFYRQSGAADSPYFPAGWRQKSIALYRAPYRATYHAILPETLMDGRSSWYVPAIANLKQGSYRMIGFDGKQWQYLPDQTVNRDVGSGVGISGQIYFFVDGHYQQVELLVDRREDMKLPRTRLK